MDVKRKVLAGLMALLALGGLSSVQAAATYEEEPAAEVQDNAKSAEPKLFPWLKVEDQRRVLHADGRMVAWVSFPEITVVGDDYPVLQRTLRNWSMEQRRHSDDAEEDLERAASELMPSFPYYEYSVVDRWGRIDDEVVSFALQSASYSGGARPQYGFSTENFDPETGERVPIDAVVTRRDILLLALADAFRRQYPGREDDLFEQDIDKALDIIHGDPDWQEYITWMLDANNDLVVFYNPYEIGPYSSGSFILTVRRDEFPEVFREDWPE
ncbi:MAG: RsiV family protein [Selenomonas noxia]